MLRSISCMGSAGCRNSYCITQVNRHEKLLCKHFLKSGKHLKFDCGLRKTLWKSGKLLGQSGLRMWKTLWKMGITLCKRCSFSELCSHITGKVNLKNQENFTNFFKESWQKGGIDNGKAKEIYEGDLQDFRRTLSSKSEGIRLV